MDAILATLEEALAETVSLLKKDQAMGEVAVSLRAEIHYPAGWNVVISCQHADTQDRLHR